MLQVSGNDKFLSAMPYLKANVSLSLKIFKYRITNGNIK